MKKFYSKFTHICLLPNMHIKCYSFHEVEKNLNNFSKCSCCDVIFYSELCLTRHCFNKLNFSDAKGEKVSKTPCQLFKYC